MRIPSPRPARLSSALVVFLLTGTALHAAPPTITAPAAAATPAMHPHWRTAVSVNATDDGGAAALTYTWSTPGTAYPATFTVNGTNAARNTVAMFNRAGSYTLRVTVRDAQGETATSDVAVTVSALRLPQVFGDNMVVQQGKPVVVWGQDNASTDVTVSIGGHSATARTGYTNGAYRWRVTLPALPASDTPQTMTVSGSSTVTFQNVLVGEVWLASGQSNMDWAVKDSTNSQAEIAAANHPGIRFLKVPQFNHASVQQDLPGVAGWVVVAPGTVNVLSGVGYYFARDLRAARGTPVGILQSAVPGTPIEPWTSPEGYATVPASVYAGANPYPSAHRLHNWMVQPLAPFAIRGALWYQGEANHNDGSLYIDKMKALVAGWRGAGLWNDPTLPVYFVQIGPYAYANDGPEAVPTFWEAQTEAARVIPHTGMAVINDISALELHPRNKQDVGRRLSLLARARTYGETELVHSGPTPRAAARRGSTLRVRFDHAAGLAARGGGPLTWFELRDTGSSAYVPATATIESDTVVLSAPGVARPDALRFAWGNTAEPNLINAAGLPAGAFRLAADPALADSVGDGLTDAWRAAHFGGDGETATAASAASADPDGDGLDNRAEFLAGTSPTDPASALRIVALTAQPLSGERSVTFTSVSGKHYDVQATDDLAAGFPETIAAAVPGTGAQVTVADPASPPSPRRFYRVVLRP